jgi:hypothetical protein
MTRIEDANFVTGCREPLDQPRTKKTSTACH